MLFAGDSPPGVIDFCPYWRPAGFALAVVIVDALDWSGAGEEIIDLVGDEPEIDQLLVRAEMYRLVTWAGVGAMGRQDWRESVAAHLPTVDLLCRRVGGTGRAP